MTGPRILILDIENSPVLADVWSLWKTNVGINQINRDWYMLTWAAKWRGEDYVYSDALTHYPEDYAENPEDDFQILATIRDMLDEADVVVGHNSNRFDLPKIRARMVTHGIAPFSPVQEVDTLVFAKKMFKFTSNKLDFISQALGVGEKMDTGGHILWTGCMRGDKKSWAMMEEYNRRDVVITEEVYNKLAPWSKSHPNYALYSGLDVSCCGVCGSRELRREGHAYTNLGKFQKYQCKDCGKWMRSRRNVADRKSVLTNIA